MRSSEKIDLTYLKRITGDADSVMVEMLQLFLSETPTQIDLLIQHADSQDWKQFKAEAHKLKPTFLYLGLVDIHSMLEVAEDNAANENSTEEIKSISVQIKEDFEILLPDLKEKIEEYSN